MIRDNFPPKNAFLSWNIGLPPAPWTWPRNLKAMAKENSEWSTMTPNRQILSCLCVCLCLSHIDVCESLRTWLLVYCSALLLRFFDAEKAGEAAYWRTTFWPMQFGPSGVKLKCELRGNSWSWSYRVQRMPAQPHRTLVPAKLAWIMFVVIVVVFGVVLLQLSLSGGMMTARNR